MNLHASALSVSQAKQKSMLVQTGELAWNP
jgi:hypothetical protein